MPSHSSQAIAFYGLSLIFSATALGSEYRFSDIDPFKQTPSISDFGGVGLMQIPTARFSEDGELVLGGSFVEPYHRYYLSLQGLPWLEGGLSYTRIQNRQDVSGEPRQDKRFDVKARLWEESKWLPQAAIGMRDAAGTGLFAGEYLVASKRYYNWDFTLGLGFGYMGTGGIQIDNPLCQLTSSFCSRKRGTTGTGGQFEFGNWFSGEKAAVFAGVQYHTPWEGLSLNIELDPNDYQSEPLNNNLEQDWPINIGASYRPYNWLDINLGFERGNTFMANFVLRSNLEQDKGLPKVDSPAEKLLAREAIQYQGTDSIEAIYQGLTRSGYQVEAVKLNNNKATVVFEQSSFRYQPQAIGRVSRIVANRVGPEIELIELVNVDDGLALSNVSILRKDLEKGVEYRGSPEEVWHNALIEEGWFDADALNFKDLRYPRLTTGFEPKLRQSIGGALDTFYAFQIYLLLNGEYEFAPGASLNGSLSLNIYDTFDDLNTPPTSDLPNVRSDIQSYLKEGTPGIETLKLDYLWKSQPTLYNRVSLGYLEEMYAGVSSEMLFSRQTDRWALGAELNWVKKRDFDKRFGLQDYDTVTGHVNWYYDWPIYDITSKISAGRYLAKDIGMTFDFSREFENGSIFGVFATFTDVSAEQFGEGSFDKGFYLSIPLDLFSTTSSDRQTSFMWRPLTRDGGQKLNIDKRLYGYTQKSSSKALAEDWKSLFD